MPSRQKSSPPTEPFRWLTVDEAAIYLRVSPGTIRGLIHRGELRAARIGTLFRLDRADLDQLMLRRKRSVAPYRRGTHPWVAKRWALQREQRAVEK